MGPKNFFHRSTYLHTAERHIRVYEHLKTYHQISKQSSRIGTTSVDSEQKGVRSEHLHSEIEGLRIQNPMFELTLKLNPPIPSKNNATHLRQTTHTKPIDDHKFGSERSPLEWHLNQTTLLIHYYEEVLFIVPSVHHELYEHASTGY